MRRFKHSIKILIDQDRVTLTGKYIRRHSAMGGD